MKTNEEFLAELKSEGLLKQDGSMNASYYKKFQNNITEERKLWVESLLGDTFSEKIYLVSQGLTDKPACKGCGAPIKFASFGEGYRGYCTFKCRSINTTELRKETCLKKYGSTTPAGSKVVQDKMKATSLARYGVENIFEKKEFIQESMINKYGESNPMKVKAIRDKATYTNMSKYGVEHPLQNQEIKTKVANTNMDKYGNICSLHGEEIQKKVREVRKQDFFNRLINSDRLKSLVTPFFTVDDYEGAIIKGDKIATRKYEWRCNKCSTVFSDHLANGIIPRCPTCNPRVIRGKEEARFVSWLKSILPVDTKILLGDRIILSPQELDVYLPDYKIAIEFNEVYWHSENASMHRSKTGKKRGMLYHSNKTNECKKQGIKLIHVLETEWLNKPEVVKSMIKAKFGLYDLKLGARSCSVREITSKESQAFLDSNHIQGEAKSSIRYGLFYKGDLVAHLALGKNRFKPNTYEVIRFVTKINTQVVGGLSKLWSEVKKLLPKDYTLISYVDLRWFTGESNNVLGLAYQNSNRPAYSYTKDYKILYNRMHFQKKNIEKHLPLYDKDLTEWENMQMNGYDRIWDCGTAVYSN